MLGPVGSDDFEVWPENWQVVEVFYALTTQWRVSLGWRGKVYQGLDYTAVESVLRMLKVRNRAEVLSGLMVMEGAALKVLNRT